LTGWGWWAGSSSCRFPALNARQEGCLEASLDEDDRFGAAFATHFLDD
jgi:hypothetical protein